MAYKRHDKDNNEVSPQPGSTTVNQFSGNRVGVQSHIKILMLTSKLVTQTEALEHLAHIRQENLITALELLQHISVTIKIITR